MQSISIVPNELSIAKGLGRILVVTGTYSDGTSQALTTGVTWASDKTTIATVTSSGLVNAVNAGSANISATVGSITASTAFTVSAATLQSISISPANSSVTKGLTQTLVATGTYSDGTSQALTTSVTWSSDKTTVATVTSSGLVTAVSAGSASIFAKVGSIATSTAFTVTARTLQSISITPTNPTLAAGLTKKLIATVTFSDGTSAMVDGVKWSSSNAAAIIDSSGTVRAITSGISLMISASFSYEAVEVIAGTTLTTTPAIPQSLIITPLNSYLVVGETKLFKVSTVYSDSSTSQPLITDVTWSSDNTTIAKAINTGLITAISAGSANIIAKYQGIEARTNIIVEAKPTSITIGPTSLDVITREPKYETSINSGFGLKATAKYPNGTTRVLSDDEVFWSSGSPNILIVSRTANPSFGYSVSAKGVKAGSSTLTAIYAGVSTTVNVTVK